MYTGWHVTAMTFKDPPSDSTAWIWYGTNTWYVGSTVQKEIEFEETESVQQIKYGRYPTENNRAMCYPTFITNLRTYGPYGADMNSATDGVQPTAECDNEVKGYQTKLQGYKR